MNEDTFLNVSYIQKDGFDLKIGFERCFLKKMIQKGFILLHNKILNSRIHLIYNIIVAKYITYIYEYL